MRVLINIPRLTMPGGVSNYYLVLRPYLDAGKEYFEIGTDPAASGLGGLVKRLLVDYWRFHRALSAGQFDLVHLNPSLDEKSLLRDSIFLLIAAAHRTPVLVFFHGWNARLQALIASRLRWVFKAVFGKAKGFVVLANDFRYQLETMGVNRPMFLMTTLVDDAVFLESPAVRESKVPVQILYLSRLAQYKGAVEAVQAFALLKRSISGVTLRIAGDGPEKEKTEAVARTLSVDDVRFLGHIEGATKHEAFMTADIYFFPTFCDEGMPTTVIEAMAYGLPVITRSVGGLKDFFQNERMGFVTESRDPHELSVLLERLVSNPELRRLTGNFNRRYAQEHFAASSVAKQLESIYERLTG